MDKYWEVKLSSSGVERSLRNLNLSSFAISVVRGRSANKRVLPSLELEVDELCSPSWEEGEEGSLSNTKYHLKVFDYLNGLTYF